jgi:hypothetical protein
LTMFYFERLCPLPQLPAGPERTRRLIGRALSKD